MVILEESKQTASENPRWYSTMVAVKGALGLPRSVVLATAREGLAKNPAHFQTAINALINVYPQWGGSAQQVRSWIEEAAAAAKHSEGDGVYALLYWEAMKSADATSIIGGEFDWKRMAKAMDDFVAHHPTLEHMVKAMDMSCQSQNEAEVMRRWSVVAEVAGPSFSRIVPEVYCRWPRSKARTPGVVDPADIADPDAPRKAGLR